MFSCCSNWSTDARFSYCSWAVMHIVVRLRSQSCVDALYLQCGAAGAPEQWKWTFCHRPEILCHMRVSSDWYVTGAPLLKSNRQLPAVTNQSINRYLITTTTTTTIIIINRQFLTRRNIELHHPLQGRELSMYREIQWCFDMNEWMNEMNEW